MKEMLTIISMAALLFGLVSAAATLPYRTAEYRALPWYKQFVPRWRVASFYRPPGPFLASLSSSLLALGGVLLVAALVAK